MKRLALIALLVLLLPLSAVPCGTSSFPACGGDCPLGQICEPSPTALACVCEPVTCANGNNLTLRDDTLLSEESYEVCETVTLGPSYVIAGPDGHLILHVGIGMEATNGLAVETGGRLTVNMLCDSGNQISDTCFVATNLGTVFDWEGSGPIEVVVTNQWVGPGMSRWYKLHAADLPGDDWKLLAKIFNIRSGSNLDLYAYRRSSSNACSSTPPVPSGSCNENISGCGGNLENSNRCSQNSGNGNECVSWFESCTGFLEDDETEIWIEVRHVSGGCGTFDLKIRNNGNNDSLTCVIY